MLKTCLALTLLLLTGCAEFNSGFGSGNGDSNPYNDPYARSDFDELLVFGANMANIPPSSRAEVCGLLIKRQKDSPGVGIQLHLMIGRLLSDTCGDISGILNEMSAIPPGSLTDEKVQKLVAINTETLKRMNSATKKLGSLERKRKTVQSVLESKGANGSKKNEARLLREKLEAIRSMEKQMDEQDGGN